MQTIIDRIKQATSLTDLVAQTFTLTGRDGAPTRSTVEHDSLIIWTDTNTWRWFSEDTGGDVLDWVQHRDRCDIAQAIETLATAANIERRPLTPEEQQQRTQQQAHHAILQIAAQHYHRLLTDHPDAQPARAYCAHRAWTPATIAAEMIGCTLPINQSTNQPTSADNNHLSLDKQLREAGLWGAWGRPAWRLDHPTAKAVLSIPPNMLVYVHRRGGQVVYLSGRSIKGKRHYNLPNDIGPKQPYHNSARHYGQTVLVEGQADAISLAQLGIPAIALCGLGGADMSKTAQTLTHIGLDADEHGTDSAINIAMQIGPMLPIIEWRRGNEADEPKDANAWLIATGPDARKPLEALLANAQPALLHMARATRRLTGDLRTESQRQVLDAYLALDELVAADLRPDLTKALGVGVAQLNNMTKARIKEQEEEAKANPTDSAQRDQYSAGGYIGGHLIEQFVEWDAAGEPFAYYYIRYPDGKIDRAASITIGGTCYMPISPMDDENITKQTVCFPSALADYGSETQLLADIRAFLHKWFDMEPFWERIASYYVLFTWFYDAGFETIPYLRALGDYGTGKTRFIESTGLLCYRPMLISGGDSEPVIFRMIDTYRGTMIVDEADFGDSAANALVSKIINMGNRITGNIKRLDGDNDYKVKVFMVFCPKVFAARNDFGDDALGSRCLTKFMTKSDPRHDVPRDTDPSFREDARHIRNKLVHYRLKTWRPIAVDHSLTDYTIMARLSQITLALRTIIKDPDALAELDTYIQIYNASLIGERSMTDQAIIVHALARIYYGLDQADAMIKTPADFTLGNIVKVAQELMNELDPSRSFNSFNISPILRNQLGLSRGKRDNSRRSDGSRGGSTINVEEPHLLQLMARYGINLDETDQ